MDLARLIAIAAHLKSHAPGATYAHNLVKLAEETGELARTLSHPAPRQAVIDEVADVIIVAAVQGAFVDMSAAELAEALARKSARSLSRCPVPLPGEEG